MERTGEQLGFGCELGLVGAEGDADADTEPMELALLAAERGR